MPFRFTELRDEQRELYFRFPHALVADRVWRSLPKSAHAVLCALGVHADQHGAARPSEARLAGLCGLTEKTVRAAARSLEDTLPGFKIQNYTTRRGKRAKSYRIGHLPTDSKKYFAFRRRWIDGGNWFELHRAPSAWSLYPVMRHLAFPDAAECINGDEEEHHENGIAPEVYAARAFDLCDAEPWLLRDLAGITRNSLPKALRALQDAGFISPEEDSDCWQVYRMPQIFFKRAYLNRVLEERGM